MLKMLSYGLGLTLAVFGFALLLDFLIVQRAAATPIPNPCDCLRAKDSDSYCLKGTWVECPGQGETSCKMHAIGDGKTAPQAIQFFGTGKVPDGCIATTSKVKCGTEKINCHKLVFCKWNDTVNPAVCEVDTKNDPGYVKSAEKRKTEDCKDPNAKCPGQ